MVLVTTMMTTREMTDNEVDQALKIIANKMGKTAKSSKHNYGDRIYFETDIDLIDVEFTKKTLQEGIHQLIFAYEEILETLPIQIDFIAANDDTETEILRYEKDINDVRDFGLFVTKRTIPGIEPYYFSEICNAYVNLTHVSFGVYY